MVTEYSTLVSKGFAVVSLSSTVVLHCSSVVSYAPLLCLSVVSGVKVLHCGVTVPHCGVTVLNCGVTILHCVVTVHQCDVTVLHCGVTFCTVAL